MPRRNADAPFVVRKALRLPFDFVLEELAVLNPWTRPMFGCHAVYVEDKIVFVLRDKGKPICDDGVWIATTVEHHQTLRAEMPSMRSVSVLAGGGVTGWQVLPSDADDFEESVLCACAMVCKRDVRLGKVPKPRRPRKSKRRAESQKSQRHNS
ncbi:MAG: hypothetical protein M3O46_09655 [Myxococcota bacterium]|nr:hypothetical protein [Myxococcota bacterium]